MEAVLGAASGLVNGVVKLLSNELVEAYVASAELGLNSDKIKRDLMYTQGLLHEAGLNGVARENPGLKGLLLQLNAKADEAEDALDELHCFIIQDQLNGTQYAVPDLGDGLRGHARHGRHALLHAVGNCLACFSCSHTIQDRDKAAPAVTTKPRNASASKPDSGDNDAPVDKLSFDRVVMSKKIKSVIEEIHSLCEPVSKLLNIVPHHSSSTAIVNLKRPLIGSTAAQDTLYGRRDLFEQTIKDIITSGTNCSKTLSVLPIVGPGGIGKTTFTQHLYNDRRIQENFTVRVWVCVSTDFDVLKLSQQILSCIDGSNNANQTSLDQLQKSIAERLKSKRFLIVFDDIWECNSQGWENLLAPVKKGEAKGNMVLVTTRLPSIADMVKTTEPIALEGLEPDEFLTFFEAIMFEGKKPEYYQDDLTDLARDIAKKLKGSPLAAKTVGRILKKDLSREHWMRVLENNEWQNAKTDDDIMPSLRISYDYLPFRLKKCFTYISLFPEDYRYRNVEITYFWIAIGVIDKVESCMELEELVDYGFLMKENDEEGQYYVLHDLLHELSRSVSSQECLNISSSVSFRADAIPKSIRHLSITMEDRFDQNFMGEMDKLRSKVDIANLRTLMIFRKYGETIDDILKDTFKEIVGLRVLFIVVESQKTFPCILSKLIHLRYLKISTFNSEVTLPRSLSRFYHLKFLDLENWEGSEKLPKDINRLINLHHLLARDELHSNVPEVGKMKCLKELKAFHVKKESAGFELSELGELTDLGGNLGIHNLEKVATKEEAMKAKLASKGDLKGLSLVWGGIEHRRGESDVRDSTTESSDVLDGLEPHPNLRSLVIINHGGSTGPRWLCCDISIQMLKSLHLEGVSWDTFPPFGQLVHLTSLILIRISGLGQISPGLGGVTDKSFLHLEVIVLDTLPEFTEWVGVPNAHAFSRLEKIRCKGCPNLYTLPFLQECSTVSYNHLREVEICGCPNLSMPPMPHTSTLTQVEISDSPVGRLWYDGDYLILTGYSGALALHNVAGKLKCIIFREGSKIPWAQLPRLTLLESISIIGDPNFVSMALLSNLTSLTDLALEDCTNLTVDGFNPLISVVNLKKFRVHNTGRDGPRSVAADLLLELAVASRAKLVLPSAGSFFQLERLHVDSISAVLSAPVCSLLAATLHDLIFDSDQQVESFTEEEENALQLLNSLQFLAFRNCPGLPSLPQGLHSLSSLGSLSVSRCPQIQSLPKKGLPTSLVIRGCPEIRSLPKEGIPTSLRYLIIIDCSPELKEQAKELQATYPDRLDVTLNY